MRTLATVIVVLGLVAVVVDAVVFMGHLRAPGAAPFTHEGYGGPGPFLGAIVMVAVGLYLRGAARRA
jgi:hypothetical protein